MPLKGVVATGECGSEEQNLTLTWNTTGDMSNIVTLHFVKNATKKNYALHCIEATLLTSQFPNANTTGEFESHYPRVFTILMALVVKDSLETLIIIASFCFFNTQTKQSSTCTWETSLALV